MAIAVSSITPSSSYLYPIQGNLKWDDTITINFVEDGEPDELDEFIYRITVTATEIT